MSTGPVSSPFIVTDRLALALSLSVMVAVAAAVATGMATAAFDGFAIVASSVSSASRVASSSTGTMSVPVVAPTATLMTPGPPTSV